MTYDELQHYCKELEIKVSFLENEIAVGQQEFEFSNNKNAALFDALKVANSDLSNLRDNLQAMVDEKSKELIAKNRELHLALLKSENMAQKAEDANKAKTDFLANMSHEIRTPLSGVLGMAELLANTEPLSDEQLGFVRDIRYSAKSLLTLINDILDFSKVEAGKMKFESHPFNFRKWVMRFVSAHRVSAVAKGLKFNVDINQMVPENFIADSFRIQQIILNLISNAIKFTEHGSVELIINSNKISEEKYEVKFVVLDTGIGISKEHKKKLFDVFEQGDSSIARKFGGTGLGLAISLKLVKLMGGEISFQSEVGKGSMFCVVLPLDAYYGECKDISDTQKFVFNAKSMKNVLLVDDSEMNRKYVRTLLERTGYLVTLAENGQEALDIMRRKKFDIVLADIMMLGMTGYDMAERIREFNKTVPIIALTANAQETEKEKSIACGMAAHITKPIDSKLMLETIKKFAL